MASSIPESWTAATVPTPKAACTLTRASLSPPLGDAEVLIKITATAINPVDWKMRDRAMFLPSYPAILGSDAAGTVAAAGSAVTHLHPGDRVFFQGIIGQYASCTFQQYCRMPATLVARTPPNVSDDAAAGLSLATVCAATALYSPAGLGLPPPWAPGGAHAGRGRAVVVLGGASSVGQYAVQLARLSGFGRIVTSASPHHAELLRALGAHVVLDRRAHGGAEDFAKALEGAPLALVLDAVSLGTTQRLGVEIVRAAARELGAPVVVVQAPDEGATRLGEEAEPKVQVKMVMGMGSHADLRPLAEGLFGFLGGEAGVLAKGELVSNRPEVVPGGLGAVEAAMAKNRDGVSGVKVVIRPHETTSS
ncbi:hypothetical protein P8C59_004432 [Phyllachora maydis]|uniref:Enoyl reductase (ER) domain-containing protein n=1 Tax=Phyllachora maydis TaxID=1825666 RepID=A0AAD9MDG7_9PEZI|nr:hypothetical protein P8C59_004432 [Phyllachora maydis]